MELVYLWVEDYKNIKQQGFNFSPQFECSYDEGKKELTIDEKENYVNIFPENINVTAIVGENGSGKSSLLEQLMLLFYSFKELDTENPNMAWILTYDKEKKWIDINYFNQENPGFDKIDIKNKCLRQNSVDSDSEKYYFYNSNFDKSKYYNLFYNPSIELVSSSFLRYIDDTLKNQDGAIYDLDFKPEELNIFAFPSKKKRIIDIKKNENNITLTMYKSIEVLKIENIELKLNKLLNNKKLNFIPSRVQFLFDIDDTEDLIKHNNQKIKDILFTTYNDLSLKSLYAYFITSILSIAKEDNKTKEFKDSFFQDGLIKEYLKKTYLEQKKQIPENDTVPPIYKFTKYILANIEVFINLTVDISLSASLKESSIKLNADIFETAKLIDTLKTLDNVDTLNYEQSDIKIILKILPDIPSYIRVNVSDKNNVAFNDFSYGEKNIISLIYSLSYYVHFFSSNNTINLFLDEIETGLNPKWQKELINILIPFFSKLNISLNIIISSHSPFILSDLPKENVIFLKKGKQDNPDIEQTFGANIHTLLSHGFFMQDGLMGEFAKGKINEVYKFLSDDNYDGDMTRNKAEQIIKIIGEPVLQKELQKLFDKNIDIDGQIKAHEDEIAKLKAKKEQQ